MAVLGPHDKEFVYYCLDTDTKPLSPIGNSVLFVIDEATLTVTKFRYSGSQWVEEVNAESQPTALKMYEDGLDLYVCKAEVASSLASAVWQVKKINTSADLSITWADGNSKHDNLATNLATVKAFSYS